MGTLDEDRARSMTDEGGPALPAEAIPEDASETVPKDSRGSAARNPA
jgi:hypothetical protein